jgi:hypothetical protein
MLALVLVLWCCTITGAAYAADLTVSPILLDHEVAPRDIVTETITIQNISNHKLNVYATINEIALETDGSIKAYLPPGQRGDGDTILDWVEFTRGRIEVMPGESAEVPVTIRIPASVEPGNYQAFIGFSAASKRYQAEAQALAGEAKGVVVRLAMPDQRIEGVRLARFVVDRFVTGNDEHVATVMLENVGEVAVAPVGDIIFFNNRGEEVGAITVNAQGDILAPGTTKTFTEPVPVTSGLGRYKANLRLTYGETQRAQLMDTSFFFIFPWHIVLGLFLGVLTLVGLTILVIRRYIATEAEAEDGSDVPLYVVQRTDHPSFEHDINLKQ